MTTQHQVILGVRIYISVVSDYFMKWTESFSVANMGARAEADIMVREDITRFGRTSKIYSNQRRQYKAMYSQNCASSGI